MAIVDLYGRYVVGWSLSISMTSEWCWNILREAVNVLGKPEIINSDQGSQFTSEAFTSSATDELKITLNMDGKGRAIDKVFVERLWRSVKYEQAYLFPLPMDWKPIKVSISTSSTSTPSEGTKA